MKPIDIARFTAGLGQSPLSASYYVFNIASVFDFLGSLFSRVFWGVTGLAFNTICNRDGCTRDFVCGRYENLSSAIVVDFSAGGAAAVRRSRSDWRRELSQNSESRGAVAVQPSRPAAAA